MKKLFLYFFVFTLLFSGTCVLAQDARMATLVAEDANGKFSTRKISLKEIAPRVWRAKIAKKDIDPTIKAIDVIFDNAQAVKGEDGYFVLGDNRLGHFTADKGTLLAWKLFMPMFGMKNPRGAWVGIIKSMDYECGVKVEVKGGVYKIYPHFEIAKRGGAYEDIIVDFYELAEDEGNYSAMARKYREYKLSKGKIKSLRERVKNNPYLAHTAKSVFVRIKLAMKDPKNRVAHQTPESEPKLIAYCTYEKFGQIMKKLKGMGVDDVEMCMVGWQAGGFDGRYPQYFPIPEKLGGEAKLRETITLAKSLGYQIVCHTNSTEWVEIGEGFDINDIIHDHTGKRPKLGGAWLGGCTFQPCMKRVWERFTRRDFKMIADLGFKGTHHIDVLGCMRSRFCSHPDHPVNNKESVKYMRRIAREAKRVFGGYGTECGIDHSADIQDYALYISAYPKYMGGKHPLVDTLVPMWQIVYHGFILSNPYLETLDYSYAKKQTMLNVEFLKTPEARRLKVFEYGGRPTFYFANYADLNPIKTAHDDYKKVRHLQFEFMQEHKEISPNVFSVHYSNGEEMICNYNKTPFDYNGVKVAPMDYVLLTPKK